MRDISGVNGEGECVDLMLGCDASEARWTMRLGIEDCQAAFVMRMAVKCVI